jgi:putative FmdB family regulatory protein
MPLYEYRCERCGEIFEKLRRISEADTPAECPRCESAVARRILSTFATGGCGAPAGGRFR